MRRVLIVSPHFPPLNAPDMQRVRMSLPYYRNEGWEPVVLCVGERHQHGVFEPELNATIPADIRIVRTGALPIAWTRRLGLRNLGLRCWLHFLVSGARLLRHERFDLVFFSTTQFAVYPLGRIWRSWFGVPYVLDVQDPWLTEHYQQPGAGAPPGGWKYRVAHGMARLLEGWSFRKAAGILSVSPKYITDLQSRYPELTNRPAAMLPFGASRHDLELLARRPKREGLGADGKIHFVYTGAAGPIVPHSLNALFGAVAHYRQRNPGPAQRLAFHFVGTSYVPPGSGVESVMPLAREWGIADQVSEVPHRLGLLDALAWQSDADVLFLAGSADLAYSPSKLFPYFLSERPILALVFADSVLARQVRQMGGAHVIELPRPDTPELARAPLSAYFDRVLESKHPLEGPPRQDAWFREHCLAESLTARQCRWFSEVCTAARRSAERPRTVR